MAVVRGLAERVLPAGEHGPGARSLVRPRSQDMFALGAREAVVAAVRGVDADCFGSPVAAEELAQALATCGLEATAPGSRWSWRCRPTTCATRGRRRAGRLLAHAHGWRPHSDAPRGRPGDSVTLSPESSVDSSTASTQPTKADQWPRRTHATTSDARSSSRCASEQARKERTRSLAILGVCSVIVIGLLTAAVIPYLKQQHEKNKIAGTPSQDRRLGLGGRVLARSRPRRATGSRQHVTIGQKINYPDAPPAFGKHWGNFLQGSEMRTFYTTRTARRSSGWCTASSTATRSSGTTTP